MIPAGRYTRIAMLLHWLVAALILANVALIYTAHQMPEETGLQMIDVHESIGLTVLGLAILRLLWRLGHRPPPLRVTSRWERVAAHSAHAALYVIMLALPLSGWMHDSAWKEAAAHPFYWFGLFEWPRIRWITAVDPEHREILHSQFLTLHTWCGYILYALLAAHITGALKHQWLDRQPTLQRITPWGRTATEVSD